MEDGALPGSVAFVTGASRGIGREAALALADAGADVALNARTEADLIEIAELVPAADGARFEGNRSDVGRLSLRDSSATKLRAGWQDLVHARKPTLLSSWKVEDPWRSFASQLCVAPEMNPRRARDDRRRRRHDARGPHPEYPLLNRPAARAGRPRIPGPAWFPYAVAWAILALLETVLKWATGAYSAGTIYPYHLVAMGTAVNGLGFMHVLDKYAARAPDTLCPCLDLSDAEAADVRH